MKTKIRFVGVGMGVFLPLFLAFALNAAVGIDDDLATCLLIINNASVSGDNRRDAGNPFKQPRQLLRPQRPLPVVTALLKGCLTEGGAGEGQAAEIGSTGRAAMLARAARVPGFYPPWSPVIGREGGGVFQGSGKWTGGLFHPRTKKTQQNVDNVGLDGLENGKKV